MAKATRTGVIAVISGLTFVLAGCEDGTSFFPTTRNDPAADAAVSSGQPAGKIIEQDVEAPDVFAANETGLWDGRPSLGGVWVAHPEVAEPERVIIRNEANGNFVIGALFRRERENPGPRIQVSSDAASELGMLAGQPAVLDVIALRRETVEIPPETIEPALVDPMVIASETTLEDIDAETAAVDGELTDDAEVPDIGPKPKKKKGLFAAIFGGGKAASKATEPVAPVAAGAIETASIDPVATATAAIDEAEAGAAATAAPAAAAQPAQATATASAPAPREPYVQIGIFSVEENAENTANSLRSAGLVPTVRAQKSSGKEFWRVVVGPATNEEDRRAILATVRDLGFADAYYVTN